MLGRIEKTQALLSRQRPKYGPGILHDEYVRFVEHLLKHGELRAMAALKGANAAPSVPEK